LSLFALGYLNQIYLDTDKNDSKHLRPTETIRSCPRIRKAIIAKKNSEIINPELPLEK
jgi:hypothetical protein